MKILRSLVKASIYPAQSQLSLKFRSSFIKKSKETMGAQIFMIWSIQKQFMSHAVPGEIDAPVEYNHQAQCIPLLPNRHPKNSLLAGNQCLSMPVTLPDPDTGAITSPTAKYMPFLPNIDLIPKPHLSETVLPDH